MERSESEIGKLSVNVTPEVTKAIRELAERRGITVSEPVRDALVAKKSLVNLIEKWNPLLRRIGEDSK